MIRRLFTLLAIVMFLIIGTVYSVNATLFVRGTDTIGNQLIYDSDLDITWYDYTNQSNPWYDQIAWAETLTVDFEEAVYDDWRLPTTPGTQHNYGVNEGEMGHLFCLDNIPDSATNPFYNITDSAYWTGTTDIVNPDVAFHFISSACCQMLGQKCEQYWAIAVRDGDVAAPVPEPATMLLLGTGLIGITSLKRRKKKGIL